MSDYEDIKHRGYVRGRQMAARIDMVNIGDKVNFEHANWQDVLDGKQRREAMIYAASITEEADREFSPFEMTACEFNNSDDAEECWQHFDDGITQGIVEEVDARIERQASRPVAQVIELRRAQ